MYHTSKPHRKVRLTGTSRLPVLPVGPLLEPQEIVPQGSLLRLYKQLHSWNDGTVAWAQSPPVSAARMRIDTHKAREKAPSEEQDSL